MKKNGLWITIIIACLLFGVAAASETEAVPSPALSVTVTQVVAQDETKVIPEGFLLREVELEGLEEEQVLEVLPEATGELYVKLQEAEAETSAISVLIPEEKMEAVVAELPAETVVENLVVSEFIPMEVSGYEVEIGDVEATITVPGEYTAETPVVTLLGIWNGEEMEWFVAEVVVGEEGELQVSFTAEMLEKMNVNESVLLILREN